MFRLAKRAAELQKPPMALSIWPGWTIPDDELRVSVARSGGPGGQHVNKVSTKVQVWYAALRSRALSSDQKARLVARYPNIITSEGELLISCDETRSQETNRRRALEKLAAVLRSVARPAARRIGTRPSRSSVERRLRDKRVRAQLKRGRAPRETE